MKISSVWKPVVCIFVVCGLWMTSLNRPLVKYGVFMAPPTPIVICRIPFSRPPPLAPPPPPPPPPLPHYTPPSTSHLMMIQTNLQSKPIQIPTKLLTLSMISTLSRPFPPPPPPPSVSRVIESPQRPWLTTGPFQNADAGRAHRRSSTTTGFEMVAELRHTVARRWLVSASEEASMKEEEKDKHDWISVRVVKPRHVTGPISLDQLYVVAGDLFLLLHIRGGNVAKCVKSVPLSHRPKGLVPPATRQIEFSDNVPVATPPKTSAHHAIVLSVYGVIETLRHRKSDQRDKVKTWIVRELARLLQCETRQIESISPSTVESISPSTVESISPPISSLDMLASVTMAAPNHDAYPTAFGNLPLPTKMLID